VSVQDSRNRGGTGLGLAIAKHIISRHRGKLLIESEPGHGSTFTIQMLSAK
jgi:two-component system, OmpR family, phosphate regulon sensor histidine kinase PhoR